MIIRTSIQAVGVLFIQKNERRLKIGTEIKKSASEKSGFCR